jgi:hypothetical protein
MAEERDRNKRYANPPKVKHGKVQNKSESRAQTEVERSTAKGTGAPSDAHPGSVGKVGSDPGPQGGHDPGWGVIAERHKTEHGAMIKRHADELGATHERHGKESKDMHSKHSKEMQDHMEQAGEGKMIASAGSARQRGGQSTDARA